MKATGIVRKIDPLGRVVIPKELRNVFDMMPDDSVEFFTDGDSITLKKYSPACIFCGECKEVIEFEGKNICKKCIKKIQKV